MKEFATDETYGLKNKAQVYIYDVDKNDFSIRNIKTIAHRTYLYSPLTEENIRQSYMEDKLADLESLLSTIWKEIAHENIYLTKNYKKSIALFMATLMLRHPNMKDDIQNFRNKLCNDVLKNIPKGTKEFLLETKGKEMVVNIEEIYETLNESEDDKKTFFIETLDRSAMNITELLLKKKWSIIFSKEKEFITSDQPVALSNPKTGLLGIDSEGLIIYFPLSPTRLLVLEDNLDNENDVTYYPLNKGKATYFNHPIFSNAYKYGISHRKFEEIIVEMDEYYGDKRGI